MLDIVKPGVVAGEPKEGSMECLTFRVGTELFALELAAIEEAIELPDVHRVPEMPEAMLGVLRLRERLVPVYSPEHVLGVALNSATPVALVMYLLGRRIALAVDDVEDVLHLVLAELRRTPVPEAGKGILLGVARSGRDIIALADGNAIARSCLADRLDEPPMEAS